MRAEESLASISSGQVAAATAKPAAAKRTVSRLQRDASAGRKRPADPNRLRAAGIQVEHRTVSRGGEG